MFKESRGVRLRNPGNIRKSKAVWIGETLGGDSAFETFDSPEHGIRALAKLITNYHAQGFDTIHKMIDRYAPPNENDTKEYIAFVAKNVGINKDEYVDLTEDLFNIVKSIIRVENGYDPYSDVTIQDGIDLV